MFLGRESLSWERGWGSCDLLSSPPPPKATACGMDTSRIATTHAAVYDPKEEKDPMRGDWLRRHVRFGRESDAGREWLRLG
jgi:hypothetical protein